MTHEESEAREAVALVCRRLWERGLVAGQDGNVSVRLESGRILITPAGFSKVDVCPQHLVALADDGTWDGGPLVPSSESALHLRAYARRPDIGAVVHAHPVWATALGLAGG